MFEIDIPTVNAGGLPIKDIGIWCSGGADSSLLLFLLAEKIKKENLDIIIHPYTVRRPRPTNPPYAINAVLKIRELLDLKDTIIDDHIIISPSLYSKSYGDTDVFRKINKNMFLDNKIQILYSGITKNPPKTVQLEFTDGISDQEYIRGEDSIRIKHITSLVVNWNDTWFHEYRAFFDMNKKQLAEIYEKNNLLDTLFPVTRSCEHLVLTDGHCGTCWWCNERKWAFNRLE